MQIEQDGFITNKKSGNDSKKTITIIIIALAVLVTIIIGIIIIMMSIAGGKLSVYVDGVKIKISEDTFFFSDDGKVYVSIKDIAPIVGYTAHNGEYKVNVENETNKAYVECKDETASFFYNSQTISKVAPNSKDDYENITISEPVIRIKDKLYVISDGFTSGFNCLFNYNEQKNRISIQTLPSLVTLYTQPIIDYGFAKISEDFNNQKALISGLLVVSREDEKLGVITTSGEEIISPRYNKIQFIESAKEFIITNSSNNVGIAYNTGKTKITVSYEDIKVIDSALGLYLVKSNNKYGVINSQENFIIHIEYEQIGIDTTKFPADNIKNQYILCDNIIPVKYNNKWRLLDINGKRLTDEEYDEIGFTNTTIKNKIINNSLVIGNTNTIIVGKLKDKSKYSNEKIYGGVDSKGNTLIPVTFDAIYSITSGGQVTYYILYNGIEYNAIDLINAIKLLLGYKEEEINPPDEQQEQTQSQTSNEIVDTNTVLNDNSINTETTNTAETSVNPTETNNVMNTTATASNNIQANQNDIQTSTSN